MSHDIQRVVPLPFVASRWVGDDAAPLVEEEDSVMVLEDTFMATNKDGFVLRRGDEAI